VFSWQLTSLVSVTGHTSTCRNVSRLILPPPRPILPSVGQQRPNLLLNELVQPVPLDLQAFREALEEHVHRSGGLASAAPTARESVLNFSINPGGPHIMGWDSDPIQIMSVPAIPLSCSRTLSALTLDSSGSAHPAAPRSRRCTLSEASEYQRHRQPEQRDRALHEEREAVARRLDGRALAERGDPRSTREVPSRPGIPRHRKAHEALEGI
jgi:hypothetical protein